MRLYRPKSWDEALAVRSEHADAVPIAGGTDVMVALTRDHFRPPALLDLSLIPGIADWQEDGDRIHLGCGTTYTGIGERHALRLPGLAMAAREVGSRQVRNRGTIGGALGTASPTGDLHPMMLAADAEVGLCSVRGARWVPAWQYYLASGSERTALARDELIVGVRVPKPTGPQHFVKIGQRRGVVKAVCSVAVELDVRRRRARIGIGAVGDMPCRAFVAEDFLAAGLDEQAWDADEPPADDLLRRCGDLAAGGLDARTDFRAGAAYRAHATAVLVRRSLRKVWDDRRGEEVSCGSA
ncbi:CO/xanthine dehydrogenase FAD-binding subunit [Catenulispora sp. MAP5-51]|uniref:FAD binding domain-containing protein n=1 Tax=Catenulispora sp. MAP5-51 TaxID=3156298 RepID=UPI00351978A0